MLWLLIRIASGWGGRVEGGQAGCENLKKKIEGGGGGGWGRVEGGQAGCERRIEVFVKNSKKKLRGGGGGGGGGGGVGLVWSGWM